MAMLNNQRVDQIHLKKKHEFPGKFPEGHPSMVTLSS